MDIVLPGNPLSTQHIYRSTTSGGFNRTYMTKQGTDRKQEYIIEAKQQWKKQPLENSLSVAVDFYFGDKRKRDIDNFNKLWMDALEGIVYKNDCQIEELVIKKDYDKENPRIEINIVIIE